MTNKQHDDKDGLLELLKKLWLPVAGFIGAVTLAYNFYQLWLGDEETVTYFLAGSGLIILVTTLGWVGFSNKTIMHEAGRPFGQRKKEKVPRFARLYQWIARISLLGMLVGVSSGAWLLTKGQQELEDKVVLVIADFDGPEEKYGIRDQIVEQLRETTQNYDDTVILPVDEVVKSEQGSEYARKLGTKNKADLVIWAWYRPTENPNITIHIENLATTEIDNIKESETYQPQATLAELETFEVQKKLGSETSTLVAFLTGMLRYKSGDYRIAAARFQQVVDENEIATFINRHDVFFNLGYSYSKLGNYDRAVQEYNKAIELGLKNEIVYANRGVNYVDLEQYDRAIQDYNKAIEINPQYMLAYYNRGLLYGSKLNQCQSAINDFDKAIELDSVFYLAYIDRGSAYDCLNRYELAIQDYDKAIKIGKPNPLVYFNRGNVYVSMHQYLNAIRDYTKAIKVDPKFVDAYINRGSAFGVLGLSKFAIQNYNKAIEINPKSAKAYNNRGLSYYDEGNYALAIQDYDKAIELDSRYATAYFNRGLAYYGKGKYTLAIQDYDRAIEFNSQYAAAYFNRALAYRELGESTKAEADFSKYLELAGQ